MSTRSLLQLENVHSQGITGKDIRLAIIERNVNPNNPTFKDLNITVQDYTGGNVDREWEAINHGTSVVGVAVGKDFKIVDKYYPGGVAPGALVTLFIISSEHSSLLQALNGVASLAIGFDVVSISCGSDKEPDIDTEIREVIDTLKHQKTCIFAASGNDGNQKHVQYPARLPNVISVGSLTVHANLAENARSKGIDVYCYGDGVMAPWGGGINVLTGSSFATPAVAGLACLALQCAKKHRYEKLHLKDKMMHMLNYEMRARGQVHKFEPEDFLSQAFKDGSPFSKLP